MVMGTYLAALENNFNSERVQDTIKSGENLASANIKLLGKGLLISMFPRNYIRKSTTEILKSWW